MTKTLDDQWYSLDKIGTTLARARGAHCLRCGDQLDREASMRIAVKWRELMVMPKDRATYRLCRPCSVIVITEPALLETGPKLKFSLTAKRPFLRICCNCRHWITEARKVNVMGECVIAEEKLFIPNRKSQRIGFPGDFGCNCFSRIDDTIEKVNWDIVIEQSMLLMESNLQMTRPNLSQLAKDLGVEGNLLKRRFLQISGIDIVEWFVRKKMNTAKEMLKEGLGVAGATVLLGYADVSQFTKTFSTIVGMSPAQWIIEDGKIPSLQ